MAQSSDYWSVDLPELTRSGAEDVLQFVADRHNIEGSLVNPDVFLTLHIDRETVESLTKALQAAPDDQVAQSFLGILNEWLDHHS